jgi:hypothetical protein
MMTRALLPAGTFGGVVGVVVEEALVVEEVVVVEEVIAVEDAALVVEVVNA